MKRNLAIFFGVILIIAVSFTAIYRFNNPKPEIIQTVSDNSSEEPEITNSDSEPVIPEPTPITSPDDEQHETQDTVPDVSFEGAISVCIDAGHGITSRKEKEYVSPDSKEKKAANVSGTAGEEEFNLEIAMRLKSKLEQNGIRVDMTRTEHECDKSNIERAEQGNESDYCIRIHADGSSSSSAHGISVLVPAKSYYGDESFVPESKAMAQSVLDCLISETGAKNNGVVTRSDLTGFNWSKVPVILVECGFMTNPAERELLESDEYKDKITNGIAKGFLNYISRNN